MVFGVSGASPHQAKQPRLPILDHQVELFDEAVDFFEIFTTALFGFDIEGATERDHVAEVTNGIL
jgi:hypothetical protein